MTVPQTLLKDADRGLAARDDELPCLATVLDDGRLSELVGERLRITRIRYKPHTSALVAYVRTRNGKDDFGWALTLTSDGNGRLYDRARESCTHGGGMRLFRPDAGRTGAIVAVGSFEDDWALRKNLRWLARSGLERLGAVPSPGPGLLGSTARVLRYKPERRLVVMEQTSAAPIVIKAAAAAAHGELDFLFHQLQLHGIPVLPRLGGAAFSRRGISASPAWGDGDLAASDDHEAAHRAGEALASLHMFPIRTESSPAPSQQDPVRQLKSTHAMVAALVPGLDAPAAKVAARIRRQLSDTNRSDSLVHGDFSADQVLVSEMDVRLIDFDRAHFGAREEDLGSFAAIEEIGEWRGHTGAARGRRTEDLIEGYVSSGGLFAPAAVDAWAAFRMFCSSVEPFRDRAPDWAAEMARHVDRAAELIP